MAKYNNTRSKGYDSKKEERRAKILKLMEKQGLITDLKEQVKFELIPSQRGMVSGITKGKRVIKEGVVEQPIAYYADFTYYKEGKLVVEDVKGFRTEVYRIKKKLMLYVHGIRIKES